MTRAHAKYGAYIAQNDFFPVHRQLVKDGILLCLQKSQFSTSPSLEAAFGSNYFNGIFKFRDFKNISGNFSKSVFLIFSRNLNTSRNNL